MIDTNLLLQFIQDEIEFEYNTYVETLKAYKVNLIHKDINVGHILMTLEQYMEYFKKKD